MYFIIQVPIFNYKQFKNWWINVGRQILHTSFSNTELKKINQYDEQSTWGWIQ